MNTIQRLTQYLDSATGSSVVVSGIHSCSESLLAIEDFEYTLESTGFLYLTERESEYSGFTIDTSMIEQITVDGDSIIINLEDGSSYELSY